MAQAVAWLKSNSAVGNDCVPSLFFSRLNEILLSWPSGNTRGAKKIATPDVPRGAPAGRAATRKYSSGLEQNHFSPLIDQEPSEFCVASDSIAPTSEPPSCSVTNCAPANGVSTESNN